MHTIIPTAAHSWSKAPSEVNPGPSRTAFSCPPTVGVVAQVPMVAVPVQLTDEPKWSQEEPSHRLVCCAVRFWQDPSARHATSVVALGSEHVPEIRNAQSRGLSGHSVAPIGWLPAHNFAHIIHRNSVDTERKSIHKTSSIHHCCQIN